MPWIIHTDKIGECLDEVVNELNNFVAYQKLKLIVDSITAIDCFDSEGTPIPLPENGYHFFIEIADAEEKETFIQNKKISGSKFALSRFLKDLRKILFEMDQNHYEKATQELVEIRQAIKNKDPKYRDYGTQGDHILQARSETKKAAVIILTEKVVGEFVPITDAQSIIEKHIDQAYKDGYENAKKELTLQKVSK